MSPVSRSRKPKKSNSGARRSGSPASRLTGQRSHGDGPGSPRRIVLGNPFSRDGGLSAFAQSLGVQREEPAWVADVAGELLDGAAHLLQAQSPHELEDLTARLLGEYLHRMSDEHEEVGIAWLLEQVLALAARRVHSEPSAATARSAVRLLHGLRAIGNPALEHAAGEILKGLRPILRASEAAEADWLADCGKLRMTGEVWTVRDIYGARIGVIASTEYPHGRDRAVYLFDIDACATVSPAGGGAFDDVDQAAAAWRAAVGWAADSAVPMPLDQTGVEVLRCVRELELSEDFIRGDEPRAVWDEWLRAMRRVHDLSSALNRTGRAMPAERSLYHDYDPGPLTAQFRSHLEQLRGGAPLDRTEQEAVETLVGEWLEGTLPDTYYAVSPHRLQYQLELINDWREDKVTDTVKALLRDWVSFLAQASDLPADATQTALDTLAALQA
jgi:hypothetical protein